MYQGNPHFYWLNCLRVQKLINCEQLSRRVRCPNKRCGHGVAMSSIGTGVCFIQFPAANLPYSCSETCSHMALPSEFPPCLPSLRSVLPSSCQYPSRSCALPSAAKFSVCCSVESMRQACLPSVLISVVCPVRPVHHELLAGWPSVPGGVRCEGSRNQRHGSGCEVQGWRGDGV